MPKAEVQVERIMIFFSEQKAFDENKMIKVLTPDHSRISHLGHSCTLHGSTFDGFVLRQASSGTCF